MHPILLRHSRIASIARGVHSRRWGLMAAAKTITCNNTVILDSCGFADLAHYHPRMCLCKSISWSFKLFLWVMEIGLRLRFDSCVHNVSRVNFMVWPGYWYLVRRKIKLLNILVKVHFHKIYLMHLFAVSLRAQCLSSNVTSEALATKNNINSSQIDAM